MPARFEDQVKQDFVLIMGALADQRDATRSLARTVELQKQTAQEMQRLLEQQSGHLADCQASISKTEASIESLRDHLMQNYGQSTDVLEDHEARIRALENRQPPAA